MISGESSAKHQRMFISEAVAKTHKNKSLKKKKKRLHLSLETSEYHPRDSMFSFSHCFFVQGSVDVTSRRVRRSRISSKLSELDSVMIKWWQKHSSSQRTLKVHLFSFFFFQQLCTIWCLQWDVAGFRGAPICWSFDVDLNEGWAPTIHDQFLCPPQLNTALTDAGQSLNHSGHWKFSVVKSFLLPFFSLSLLFCSAALRGKHGWEDDENHSWFQSKEPNVNVIMKTI